MHADLGSGLSSNQQQSRLAKIRLVNWEYRYNKKHLILSCNLECNPYQSAKHLLPKQNYITTD